MSEWNAAHLKIKSTQLYIVALSALKINVKYLTLHFSKYYYSLMIIILYWFGNMVWGYIVSQKDGSAPQRQLFSLFSLCFMTDWLPKYASQFPTGQWFDGNFITFWHKSCNVDGKAEKMQSNAPCRDVQWAIWHLVESLVSLYIIVLTHSLYHNSAEFS